MEKNIKLAYIISAYKLPDNLVRLVDRLNTPNSNFIVHVDKNSPLEIYNEIYNRLISFENVHFIKRHKSPYRGFGHVKTTLNGLRYLSDKKINYDYLFILTGQDYPIKSNNYINNFLAKNYGKSFIEYFSMPTDNWQNGGMDRINNYFIHTKKGYKKIPRRIMSWFVKKEIPNSIEPWGGSGYFTAYRKHVDYILKFIEDNPDYLRFFKHVDIPDEIFFQTILSNSKYRKDLINDDIRYIDWSNPAECPAVLRRADFNNIKRSKDLIARKADSSIDSEILDMIDEELLND
ncbi:glycosyl transferase [Candidatus Saccharibacteria bacterium]|nr:glycosyl transferase [Candidatus Saccharibacteria bacterium]